MIPAWERLTDAHAIVPLAAAAQGALGAGLPRIWPTLGWTLLALALVALLRGLYEPRHLDVTRCTLTARRRGSQPGKSRRVRVALLSDLHAEMLWIRPETVVAELRRTPVDLVVLAGDLVSDDRHASRAEPFLAGIGAYLRESGIPGLAVTGNHDGPRARRLMQACGMDLLLDEQRRLTLADGTAVLVTGLVDRHSMRRGQAFLRAASRQASSVGSSSVGSMDPEDRPIHILLTHNPDAVLDLPEDGADFLLAGHLHGGQIYAPFGLEFRLLRHDRLPRMGYRKGPFQLRGYQVYISRGLGCVWLPLRFLSRPELPILELVVKG